MKIATRTEIANDVIAIIKDIFERNIVFLLSSVCRVFIFLSISLVSVCVVVGDICDGCDIKVMLNYLVFIFYGLSKRSFPPSSRNNPCREHDQA